MSNTSTPPPRFPLQTPPICSNPGCEELASRTESRARASSGRPYYYCQKGHKREFIQWDDNDGILDGNPHCKCGYRSRREEQTTPIPKARYRCATRECNLWEEIILDDDDDDIERFTPSPEVISSSQSSSATPSSSRSQSQPSDTPTKYRGVAPTIQPEPVIEFQTLRISTPSVSTASASTPAALTDCPRHGVGKTRILRRTDCRC